ncbi:MAG: hypothetical protein ACYC3S_18175 [Chloroflexota bacterium]
MISQFVGLAGIPFIVALTEAVKVVFPGLPARLYPLVAIVWALLINLAAASTLNGPWLAAVLEALATGLAACGLYSATKSALQG